MPFYVHDLSKNDTGLHMTLAFPHQIIPFYITCYIYCTRVLFKGRVYPWDILSFYASTIELVVECIELEAAYSVLTFAHSRSTRERLREILSQNCLIYLLVERSSPPSKIEP